MIYTTLSTGETIDFTGKNDPLTLLKKIRDSKTTLERAKELQEDLKGEVRFEIHFSKIGLFSFIFTYKTFLRKQFVILVFSYFAIAC